MCVRQLRLLTKINVLLYVHAAIQTPNQIRLWHTANYKDLFCGTDEFNNHAKTVIIDRVQSVVGLLPCINSGSCRMEELRVSDCADFETRQRRQESQLGFYLLLSTQPNEGNNKTWTL